MERGEEHKKEICGAARPAPALPHLRSRDFRRVCQASVQVRGQVLLILGCPSLNREVPHLNFSLDVIATKIEGGGLRLGHGHKPKKWLVVHAYAYIRITMKWVQSARKPFAGKISTKRRPWGPFGKL